MSRLGFSCRLEVDVNVSHAALVMLGSLVIHAVV